MKKRNATIDSQWFVVIILQLLLTIKYPRLETAFVVYLVREDENEKKKNNYWDADNSSGGK